MSDRIEVLQRMCRRLLSEQNPQVTVTTDEGGVMHLEGIHAVQFGGGMKRVLRAFGNRVACSRATGG